MTTTEPLRVKQYGNNLRISRDLLEDAVKDGDQFSAAVLRAAKPRLRWRHSSAWSDWIATRADGAKACCAWEVDGRKRRASEDLLVAFATGKSMNWWGE